LPNLKKIRSQILPLANLQLKLFAKFLKLISLFHRALQGLFKFCQNRPQKLIFLAKDKLFFNIQKWLKKYIWQSVSKRPNGNPDTNAINSLGNFFAVIV